MACMDQEELERILAELKAYQPPRAPRGLRWMDRITEPESPWTLRFLVGLMIAAYVAGFWDSLYWMFAAALLFLAMPVYEDRQKFLRERRRREDRERLE